MSVYVDDMRARVGRMIMCHMIADSEAELHGMADRIGVARRWYQGDHYDICLASRAKAIAAGAIEITRREAVRILRRRRQARAAFVSVKYQPEFQSLQLPDWQREAMKAIAKAGGSVMDMMACAYLGRIETRRRA